MQCEICHKNEATIHIQEIINGQKKALHICTECASKKNKTNQVFNGLNLAEILYNISSQMSEAVSSQANILGDQDGTSPVITCGSCGWDTLKFRETGRLGCGECYNVFKNILSRALKNMHKGTLHVGKQPNMPKHDKTGKSIIEIMNLQKKLEECVLREEYEKAAEIRDKLNSLRKKDRKGKSLPNKED